MSAARTALAATAQMTLPGAPIVYYGNEVGLSQREDHNPFPDWKDRWFREPMPWDPARWDLELKQRYNRSHRAAHLHAGVHPRQLRDRVRPRVAARL